ncbi:MAG: hypothetical protein RL341_697 [Pseudomonadota bacterium]|jgi:hypothetical protein
MLNKTVRGLHTYSALRTLALLVVAVSAVIAMPAHAFSALVSPPRVELKVKPGQTVREVIEINHTARTPGKYRLYTADWKFAPDYSVLFDDKLADNSCRPWVALERRELTLPAQGKARYRFEVTVPADATERECTFGLMVEGEEQRVASSGMSFPVSGRIGVIIYVQVGNVQPQLVITPAASAVVDGQRVPMVSVRNTGTAHGRLAGFVSGTDAAGQKIEFTPSSLPILPGETRLLSLQAALPGGAPVTIKYPVSVTGTLEWGNSKTPFSHQYAQ